MWHDIILDLDAVSNIIWNIISLFYVIFVATNMEELSHCCQVMNPVEFERPYCEVTVT